MGLESGTTISKLVSSNPTGGDPTNQGDDHLRLIKAVLKAQFPGAGGQGFAQTIRATETELNFVRGAKTNIQGQLDVHTSQINGLSGGSPVSDIPVGSKMLFYQSSAPSGWLIDTSKNDFMLRVVSSGGGKSGGSDSPILNNKVPTHNHSASSNSTGSHTHSMGGSMQLYGDPSFSTVLTGLGSQNTGSAGDHTHTITVNDNAGSSWTPKYVNVIIATKQ